MHMHTHVSSRVDQIIDQMNDSEIHTKYWVQGSWHILIYFTDEAR